MTPQDIKKNNIEFLDNIWWTRKARIQTEKRLLANAFQSQVLLLWYAFWGVAMSVYHLQSNTSGEEGSVVWVVFSVLVLSISGFINGLSFKERSGLIKECYETLHKLYQRARSNDVDPEEITKEYEQILSVCENHTDEDYYLALCIEFLTHSKDRMNELSKLPTKYIWFSMGWNKVKRGLIFGFFYFLPIAVLFLLEQKP